MASHKVEEKSAISVHGKTEYHNINLYGVLKLISLDLIQQRVYTNQESILLAHIEIFLIVTTVLTKRHGYHNKKIVNKHTGGITGRHNNVVSYMQHLRKKLQFYLCI